MTLFYILCLCLITGTLCSHIILNTDNFYSEVQKSTEAWLVIYDAPESKSGQLVSDLSTKLLDYDIKTGTVDCSNNSKNKKICLSAALKTIPSFVLYLEEPSKNPYTKKLNRQSIPFTGRANSLRSLESFISKSYNSFLSHITSVEDYENAVKDTKLPVAILSTQHTAATIPMILKSIAFRYHKSIKFLQFKNDTTELIDHFSLSDSQKLIVKSKGGETKIYEGQLSDKTSVFEFLSAYSSSSSGDNESTNSNSNGDDDSQDDDQIITSSKTLEELIKSDVDSAIILTVVENNAQAEVEGWVSKISKFHEGVVKSVQFRCGTTPSDPQTAGTGAGANLEVADQICKLLYKDKKPFIVVIPYGSSTRSQLTKSLSKWVFSIEESESARNKALESLPEDAVTPIMEYNFNNFIASSVEKKLLAVVVLSEKSSPPLMLRNIALLFKKISLIGFFPNPPAKFVQNFGTPPPPVPSLIALFEGPSEQEGASAFQVNVFDPKMFGPIKFESIRDFVIQTYSATGKKYENTDSVEDNHSPASNVEINHIETEDEWGKVCGVGFKGICAISFMNGNDTSVAEDFKSRFLSMAKSIGSSYASAFKFISVNAVCQISFADSFDVQETKLPTVVAYSPSKDRYAQLKSSFSEASTKDFLVSVISGKTSTQPLSLRPKFHDGCDIIETYVDEPLEDAGDFLAEIKREEEERAKKMKLELEEERKLAEEEKRKQASDGKKKKKKKKTTKSKSSEL